MTIGDAGITDGSAHARLMDGTYSLQRHVYDATRPFFLFGRDRLVDALDAPPGATILEVGCGTARNLIRAARRWPGTRLYGLDISSAMLETARRSVGRNALSDRIRLSHGDAGALDVGTLFNLADVDRIYFSYTLSMMPPWREAIRRAARSLSPGGSVHILDFGQYERLPSMLRHAHFAALATSHVHPRADMREVLDEIASDLDLQVESACLYRGYARSATLRRS